jgi:hypothetical protein
MHPKEIEENSEDPKFSIFQISIQTTYGPNFSMLNTFSDGHLHFIIHVLKSISFFQDLFHIYFGPPFL